MEAQNYDGVYILIKRLRGFFPEDEFAWNLNEVIRLDDISRAIQEGKEEQSSPFGDCWHYRPSEARTTEWHIRRIIYFINHPEEIRDIGLDNFCYEDYIFPIPVIEDGNHRILAAMWLNEHGKMEKVHCLYGGRLDLLDYLTGKIDECPDE